jgi:hypothetical protein
MYDDKKDRTGKAKPKAIGAAGFRENLCAILDQVIETGKPVVIRRKGRLLRIVLDDPQSKLSRLKKRDCIIGDPEDLVQMDWTHHWAERR